MPLQLFCVLQPDVPITLDVLHLVFSAFGFVHKIATFEKTSGLQALVQFDDTPTAEQVFDTLIDLQVICMPALYSPCLKSPALCPPPSLLPLPPPFHSNTGQFVPAPESWTAE